MSLPNNTQKPDVFFDASALFAAIFSSTGGARFILKLAEGGAVNLLVSSQVLAEAEGALRRKAPETLGHFALLLDRSRCRVVPNPTMGQIAHWEKVIHYRPDAAVLAAAVAVEADYLVTLDRQHFLDNPRLMEAPPLPLGTPGDFLNWFRRQVCR